MSRMWTFAGSPRRPAAGGGAGGGAASAVGDAVHADRQRRDEPALQRPARARLGEVGRPPPRGASSGAPDPDREVVLDGEERLARRRGRGERGRRRACPATPSRCAPTRRPPAKRSHVALAERASRVAAGSPAHLGAVAPPPRDERPLRVRLQRRALDPLPATVDELGVGAERSSATRWAPSLVGARGRGAVPRTTAPLTRRRRAPTVPRPDRARRRRRTAPRRRRRRSAGRRRRSAPAQDELGWLAGSRASSTLHRRPSTTATRRAITTSQQSTDGWSRSSVMSMTGWMRTLALVTRLLALLAAPAQARDGAVPGRRRPARGARSGPARSSTSTTATR